MPVRVLTPQKCALLCAADAEYEAASPKQIERLDHDGNVVTLRSKAEIAAWGGISWQRYYKLKQAGWKLKRGGSNDREQRIAELESELAILKGAS
jgi:hypothetical protein